jgi:hypothetical protein
MKYEELFDAEDLAELQMKVDLPQLTSEDDSIFIPDILIPSFRQTHPHKAYIDESTGREIVRLMISRSYN